MYVKSSVGEITVTAASACAPDELFFGFLDIILLPIQTLADACSVDKKGDKFSSVEHKLETNWYTINYNIKLKNKVFLMVNTL